ncbi:MAG: ParB/RepB/Spo0J family partition protein [Armatimonadetes bacterium]|nr:ParB/RepB/Spo0J family partition protein [Armatimonadota bacterium]
MRRALGKGLSQLLGEEEVVAHPSHVDVNAIQANARQPRRTFDDGGLEELAASILEVGVLLPLIVRPLAEGTYELIAGERRLRAAKIAGLTDVPVIVRAASAQESLELALVENVQREDISPIECANAYRQLADEFGLSHEEIGRKVSKSRTAVSNTLRLLQLPREMQNAIGAGVITEGHARAILMIDAPSRRQSLFERVVRNDLSVRETERLARGPGDANGASSPKAAVQPTVDPNWQALERALSERLGSPVTLLKRGSGGQLKVDFYDDEELQRILDVLGIQL